MEKSGLLAKSVALFSGVFLYWTLYRDGVELGDAWGVWRAADDEYFGECAGALYDLWGGGGAVYFAGAAAREKV